MKEQQILNEITKANNTAFVQNGVEVITSESKEQNRYSGVRANEDLSITFEPISKKGDAEITIELDKGEVLMVPMKSFSVTGSVLAFIL